MPELELEGAEAGAEGFIEEDPPGAFARFRETLGVLFRVPKEELDAKLAEKRAESRRGIKKSSP
ncbi:MAG TPA: hypothetical protein VGS22_19140 [Thermoanaerobaculia bacterium]|jgi:hypothetical protein|nr:hypothetical protein [Thermoanaerobaculia bacterium]